MPFTPLYQSSSNQRYVSTEQLTTAKSNFKKAKKAYKDCLFNFFKLNEQLNTFYDNYKILNIRIDYLLPFLYPIFQADYKTLNENIAKCTDELALRSNELDAAKKALQELLPDVESCNDSGSDYDDSNYYDCGSPACARP